MHLFKNLKHHELYTSNLFIVLGKQTLTCYLHDWRLEKFYFAHWTQNGRIVQVFAQLPQNQTTNPPRPSKNSHL